MNILITGGASGLGESITRTLAKILKIESILHIRVRKRMQKIESEYKNSFAINCDFQNSDSLKLLIDKISQFNLDVLINNAYAGDF